MIMSGVEDGLVLHLDSDNRDGQLQGNTWVLSIGRREDSDICLRNDTYISREHARLHWRDQGWWLEDCDSKNGSYIETDDDDDERVRSLIPLSADHLFRIGRTWLRIQPTE